MFRDVIDVVGLVVALVELLLLVRIERDGKKMLRHEAQIEHWEEQTHGLYRDWFAERRAERVARQESAKRARDTKAAKAAQLDTNNQSQVVETPPVGGKDA